MPFSIPFNSPWYDESNTRVNKTLQDKIAVVAEKVAAIWGTSLGPRSGASNDIIPLPSDSTLVAELKETLEKRLESKVSLGIPRDARDSTFVIDAVLRDPEFVAFTLEVRIGENKIISARVKPVQETASKLVPRIDNPEWDRRETGVLGLF